MFAVELHANDDRVAVPFGLKPHERALMAVQRFAQLAECVSKSGGRSAHMDDPHRAPK